MAGYNLFHHGKGKRMKKGKVRSFGAFLGLSIITLGFYYFYWLYINLKEIKEALTFDKDETVIKGAQQLYVAYISISIVAMFVTVFLTASQPDKIHLVSILFLLLGATVGALFLYYYTVSVALAQNKVNLASFRIADIYAYCIIGTVIAFIGNFIPFLGLLGGILMFVYIYKIQQQINRIWTEGKLN